MLRERVPGAENVIFSTHNHNDLGSRSRQHDRGDRPPACVRSNARSTASASAPAMRRSRRSSWRSARALTPSRADRHRHRAHPQDLEAAIDDHGLRRAAEQGDRRTQCVRARERHPSGRRAEERRDLRDHDAGERRLEQVQSGDGQAFRPRRVPRQAAGAWLRRDRRQPAERRVPPIQGSRRPQEGRLRRGHRRAGRRRGDARPRPHPLRLARRACRFEGAPDGGAGIRRSTATLVAAHAKPATARWTRRSTPSAPCSRTTRRCRSIRWVPSPKAPTPRRA